MKIPQLGPIGGRRHGGEVIKGSNQFLLCRVCRQAIDLRDLRQVIWHQRPDHDPLELDA